MTDDDNTGNTDNTPGRRPRRRPRTRWILMSIAGALVLVVAGTAISTGGYSKRYWGEERFDRFVEWKIDGMLDEVDATDDQRERVQAIVTATLADLEGARDLKREMRQDLVAVFTAETIDRGELEALRLRKLETVDSMSLRVLTGLADAAEVLTPAQRAELAEEWTARDWRD